MMSTLSKWISKLSYLEGFFVSRALHFCWLWFWGFFCCFVFFFTVSVRNVVLWCFIFSCWVLVLRTERGIYKSRARSSYFFVGWICDML